MAPGHLCSGVGLRTRLRALGRCPGRPVTEREFSLSPPWPNPSRQSTFIRFEIPVAGPVSLDIFDVAGRHIRGLIDDQAMSPGAHTVEWDGRDEQGRPVAGQIYFVRVKAADVAVSRRIVMLR